MKIKIRFFGQLAEVTGRQDLELESTGDTDALQDTLLRTFPRLKNYRYLVSVNRKLLKDPQAIEADTEIALLPPFSGG